MRFYHFAFLASSISLLSSCQAALSGLYGIREPQLLAPEQLPKLAEQYGIPAGSRNAVLDTSYWRVIRRMKQRDPDVAKNHYQLLQAVYYDAAGRQQSFHINCYAGGFPNLQWNPNGIMAQFPPAQQAPRDTALTLTEHLRYLRPLEAAATPAPADYTVVVHWSHFMTRQSRRLIEAVRQNVALAPAGTRVALVFVNTDDFYYWANKHDDAQLAAAAQQKSPAK